MQNVLSLSIVTIWLMMCHAVPGQEPDTNTKAGPSIRWRPDYKEARKEAEKRNMPMFLVFIDTRNLYCDKLLSVTCQNPKIAALLNEQFVPMQLDQSKERLLGDLLGIYQYPTTVIAAPDGKVLRKKIGFQDVDSLLKFLRPSPDESPPNPPKKTGAKQALQQTDEDSDVQKRIGCMDVEQLLTILAATGKKSESNRSR